MKENHCVVLWDLRSLAGLTSLSTFWSFPYVSFIHCVQDFSLYLVEGIGKSMSTLFSQSGILPCVQIMLSKFKNQGIH